MGQMFDVFFLEILLVALIRAPTSCSASLRNTPNEIETAHGDKVYVQRSALIVREESVAPVMYYFITDQPHPHIPTNNYIKPWETVASKPIRIKHIDDGSSRILKKNNILYVEKSKTSSKTKQ